MQVHVLNPALSQLIRSRTVAGWRRFCHSFRNPRKLTLSLVAIALACLWLGNAVVSILMREPYSPETIRSWVPLTLTVYAIWHLLKVAWQRPEQAVDWSPAEEELLVAGPFARSELLSYRLTTVLITSAFKALIASLLMLPDLPIWPIGFLGFFLALTFLELLRMVSEIIAYGISHRAYFWFRAVVISIAGTAVISAFLSGVLLATALNGNTSLSTVKLLVEFIRALTALRHTWVGILLEAPFVVYGRVITAQDPFGLAFVGWLLPGMAMVAILSWLVIRLDRHFHAVMIQAEQAGYDPRAIAARAKATDFAKRPLLRIPIPRMAGVGPIAWRQFIGAARHKWELLLVLAAPAGLALIPLLQSFDATATFFHVLAGLVFYSFLLLPAAVKFDFRRDFGRFSLLKSLPISPTSTVVGQLATPVLLTTIFQLSVLTIAVCSRPVPPGLVFAAVLLLLPLNVLIYAIENLIFLLYPHRWKQDGVEIFLRTMLVFTAKALLFGTALVLFFVGASLAHTVAAWLRETVGLGVHHGTVFLIGLTIGVALAASAFSRLLIRVFRKYDPSLDLST